MAEGLAVCSISCAPNQRQRNVILCTRHYPTEDTNHINVASYYHSLAGRDCRKSREVNTRSEEFVGRDPVN